MVSEPFAGVPLFWGVLFGVIGVGIWVGGLLFFSWLWNYFRGDDDPSSGDNV